MILKLYVIPHANKVILETPLARKGKPSLTSFRSTKHSRKMWQEYRKSVSCLYWSCELLARSSRAHCNSRNERFFNTLSRCRRCLTDTTKLDQLPPLKPPKSHRNSAPHTMFRPYNLCPFPGI